MFEKIRTRNEGALLCYLPIIGPGLEKSLEIAQVYKECGVDMIELSIPCSCPWHDGSAMQKHHVTSIDTLATIDVAFALGKRLRSLYPDWPILPMAPYSAITTYGVDRFVKACVEMKADGTLLPEYPAFTQNDPQGLRADLINNGIDYIVFCDGISSSKPETKEYDLLCDIVRGARGFIFQTAVSGPTGVRDSLATDYLKSAVNNVRKVQQIEKNETPILVGFGLSTPEHVSLAINEACADAVVVGSAVSMRIHRNENLEEISKFIRSLKAATIKQ